MAKIRQRLDALAKALGLQKPLLARAQRRYKANRRRAFVAHNQQVKAQRQADATRKHNPAGATHFDAAALRHGHVAFKNHSRAQFWLGRVKVLTQRIHGLETDHAKLAAELKKANKVAVRGNKVTGGTARQRLRVGLHTAAHNCSTGVQHNYYEQGGAAPDLAHTLKGMPYGHRFDCSSFATGIYFVCGLPDPNGGSYTPGETMYTGSLGEHGKRVSGAEAQTGDLVFYGSAPYHHVEVVDDPSKQTTVGHGSGPIDSGCFDLFGDGDYILRSYV